MASRTQIHEDADENKERVVEEPYNAEQDGHALTNIGSDGRGATSAQMHGQQRAQDATAIHRESR